MTTFHKEFAKCLKDACSKDGGTYSSSEEAAQALGYKYATSLYALKTGSTKPSKEAYAHMCKLWPSLKGLLDPDELKHRGHELPVPSIKKVVVKKTPTTSTRPSTSEDVPIAGVIMSSALAVDPFELGILISILATHPEAPRWIEALEMAKVLEFPLEKIIGALKGSINNKEKRHAA